VRRPAGLQKISDVCRDVADDGEVDQESQLEPYRRQTDGDGRNTVNILSATLVGGVSRSAKNVETVIQVSFQYIYIVHFTHPSMCVLCMYTDVSYRKNV